MTAKHEAIDIMAPRNAPILAVEDGTIARLFESKAGRHHGVAGQTDSPYEVLK